MLIISQLCFEQVGVWTALNSQVNSRRWSEDDERILSSRILGTRPHTRASTCAHKKTRERARTHRKSNDKAFIKKKLAEWCNLVNGCYTRILDNYNITPFRVCENKGNYWKIIKDYCHVYMPTRCCSWGTVPIRHIGRVVDILYRYIE